MHVYAVSWEEETDAPVIFVGGHYHQAHLRPRKVSESAAFSTVITTVRSWRLLLLSRELHDIVLYFRSFFLPLSLSLTRIIIVPVKRTRYSLGERIQEILEQYKS